MQTGCWEAKTTPRGICDLQKALSFLNLKVTETTVVVVVVLALVLVVVVVVVVVVMLILLGPCCKDQQYFFCTQGAVEEFFLFEVNRA